MKKILFLLLFILFIVSIISTTTNNTIDIQEYQEKHYENVPEEYQKYFRLGEAITGFSGDIVAAIINNIENPNWNIIAINYNSNGTFDSGLCQHNSKYIEYFSYKYNNGILYDPNNPAEAIIITFKILADNYRQLNGDMNMTICSYNQGVNGVRNNGINYNYLEKVI